MPVAAPADRRFRRAHVSPGRRIWWRRSWRRTGAAAILLAVLAGGGYALVAAAVRSPALAIERIAVRGGARVSPDEVQVLLEGLRGTNLLTVDLEGWRQRLLLSPWVADADIRRVFPDSVLVELSERQPAALGRVDGALYLIDRTGAVIGEFGPDHADLDLPIIDGLMAWRGGVPVVDERRGRLVGRLLTALLGSPEMERLLSQVDVTDAEDVIAVLKGDTVQVRIGRERFVERLQSYVELAPHLREGVPDIDYVDLRYDNRVFVGSHRTGARGRPPGTKN